MLKLYNTLTKQLEEIPKKDHLNLYTCGPTVYNYAHIGNLRTYIFEDLLQRVLEYNGYKVNRAMNITDVGHLVSDADEGEDKLEVGAKREGKQPLVLAKFYTEKFLYDLDELNVIKPEHILPATQAIPEQVEIIKILEQKKFTYIGEKAIYFDTSKLADYGKLSGQKLSEKRTAAREEVITDPDKKNPADFALWFFLKGRYKDHILHWPSPWGEGFPGWHIECSAIARKLLGQPFDIHTGGVDHIGTHHTNEIAQSEAAYGVPLANIWMHGEFLQVNEAKMAKSAGTFITLDTIKEKGFSPLDYRYFCLTAHYRTQLNFSWEALKSSKIALNKLYNFIIKDMGEQSGLGDHTGLLVEYENKFTDEINDDLNIPNALALMWRLVSDNKIKHNEKVKLILKFDQVLGLNIKKGPGVKVDIIPTELQNLLSQREMARKTRNYTKSDELRKQIEDLGYEVMDQPNGAKLKKKLKI